MIRIALAFGMIASLALAGCSGKSDTDPKYDAPKPLDKMTTAEWCAYYQNFLTNPQLSAKARDADMQRMRARGCPAA